MLTPIVPAAVGTPIGRYTPAIVVEPGPHRFAFVTGQVATDSRGRTVGVGDIRRQAEQVYANLVEVLEAAGGGLDRLVAVTVYLTARDHFAGFNEVRNRVFADLTPPSSTVVIVAGLAVPEHLLEISAIAIVDVTTPLTDDDS